MQDPQSLHKYLYVHGDPVQGVDPTGLLLGSFSFGGFLGNIGARLQLSATNAAMSTSALSYALGPALASVFFYQQTLDMLANAYAVGTGREPSTGQKLSGFGYIFYSGVLILDILPGDQTTPARALRREGRTVVGRAKE